MQRVLLIIASCFIGTVYADVAVVVHPSNTVALTQEQVSQIYLGRSKSFPDGKSVIVLGQKDGAAAAEEFNTKVLSRSNSQMKAYWSKLIFTGKGTPPQEVEGDQALLELVSSNPNAIGYVDKASVTDKVKVVASF
jgi:ABC-type phosphate transport system substrate-binding protein